MKVLRIIFFVSLFLALLGGCKSQASKPQRVGLELIADGFTAPVALIDPKDSSDRLFVVDQTGLIWIVSNGKRVAKPFLDLRSRLVKLNSFYDERGLLGLAFHPGFAKNGHFYVSYSAPPRAGLSS